MKYIYSFLLLFVSCILFASNGRAYKIYTATGKKVSFEKMIKRLKKSDIVLFGEYHNNSLGHWLQLKVTESLGKDRILMLGAEMFEADNQLPLSQYVKGEISEEEFIATTRLWNNYATDYKPLVEYAKENGLDFIATNIPRKYASLVFKQGVESLDTLSFGEKKWIAPLPFPYNSELSGYKSMLTMFDSLHVNENLPKAQAIKDATMAHFIQKNYKKGNLFIHYNGSYHSNNREGIVWYLDFYNKELEVSTISMVTSDNVEQFSMKDKYLADFIIVIDEDVLKSY